MVLGSLPLYQRFEKRKNTRPKALKSALFPASAAAKPPQKRAPPFLRKGGASEPPRLKIQSSYRQ